MRTRVAAALLAASLSLLGIACEDTIEGIQQDADDLGDEIEGMGE